MSHTDQRDSEMKVGASAPAAPTALAPLRGQAPSGLEQSRSSHGAADFCECLRRDEAYGRMIDATAAGDDEAYERARADFWRTA